MMARILDIMYEKYSRTAARILDKGTSFAYWSFKVSWYIIPVLISVIILSIIIFSITWVLYLLFYIYCIPPKSITFPLNFEYKNSFLSQLHISDNSNNGKSIFGSGNIYNNIINSEQLTNQLLYEHSEAIASVSFNNITWKLGAKDDGVNLFNNEAIQVEDRPNLYKYGIFIYYLNSLKNCIFRKLYNLLTLNWFGNKNIKKANNVVNDDILGNEIDIFVELFYYPSKYNVNMTPFQLKIELIKCTESYYKDEGLDILAKFGKTTAIEYTPDILIRFREYISLIPSLFGVKLNSFGLGLESKVVIKLVENFPLLKKYKYNSTNFNSLNHASDLIKLCGANIKMRPALHTYKANLIFQTKLRFWKEVIRNHPILMGNIVSITFTFFCLILIFLISISTGVYLLWKKHSINSYCDMHISNSQLPTGTITYNNCTPSSTYYHINSNDIGRSMPLGLSSFRENRLAPDYSSFSSTSSPVMLNGLLPLETKQIATTHSKNQYLLSETLFSENEANGNIVVYKNNIINSSTYNECTGNASDNVNSSANEDLKEIKKEPDDDLSPVNTQLTDKNTPENVNTPMPD
ncbi:hypothetical protein FG386_000580 [Cryptosporidium ryanae]|uniref:uncharacterized protein n=1 Tax=Cryptosporidium ryanae TaxID=515981 RepID=UPI00351A1182|nr:hypothetical protein FG386_000580 [Cryptosporidium ryanae]